jgi:predicted component of type VI protein secretion system
MTNSEIRKSIGKLLKPEFRKSTGNMTNSEKRKYIENFLKPEIRKTIGNFETRIQEIYWKHDELRNKEI